MQSIVPLTNHLTTHLSWRLQENGNYTVPALQQHNKQKLSPSCRATLHVPISASSRQFLLGLLFPLTFVFWGDFYLVELQQPFTGCFIFTACSVTMGRCALSMPGFPEVSYDPHYIHLPLEKSRNSNKTLPKFYMRHSLLPTPQTESLEWMSANRHHYPFFCL